MLRSLAVFCFLLLCMNLCAQRHFVVVDMETITPLKDVIVRNGRDTVSISHWDGTFTLDTIGNTITLSKPGYLQRVMNRSELTDTISLLPSFTKLSEVIIWGKQTTKSIHFTLSPMSKTEVNMIRGGQNGMNLDIMGGIEKLFNNKKRKNAAKVREVLKKY